MELKKSTYFKYVHISNWCYDSVCAQSQVLLEETNEKIYFPYCIIRKLIFNNPAIQLIHLLAWK